MGALISVLVGCSPIIHKPGTFKVKTGTVFLVDDGKCPKGQITKITGAGRKRTSSKMRQCIPLPQDSILPKNILG